MICISSSDKPLLVPLESVRVPERGMTPWRAARERKGPYKGDLGFCVQGRRTGGTGADGSDAAEHGGSMYRYSKYETVELLRC